MIAVERDTCTTCGKERAYISPRQRERGYGVSGLCRDCWAESRSVVGSRRVSKKGYPWVRVSDSEREAYPDLVYMGRFTVEHRYVIRRAIGRPFKVGETVHHINGDKTDNRLENLELVLGRRHAHGPGQRMVCPACGYSAVVFVGISGGGLV